MCVCLTFTPFAHSLSPPTHSDHSVYLWDLGMQKREQVYNTHTDQVWCVAYDRTDKIGKRFASVGDDALCQMYE